MMLYRYSIPEGYCNISHDRIAKPHAHPWTSSRCIYANQDSHCVHWLWLGSEVLEVSLSSGACSDPLSGFVCRSDRFTISPSISYYSPTVLRALGVQMPLPHALVNSSFSKKDVTTVCIGKEGSHQVRCWYHNKMRPLLGFQWHDVDVADVQSLTAACLCPTAPRSP